jgi:hypothetical protein
MVASLGSKEVMDRETPPPSPPTMTKTPIGVAADDGILIHFTNWITVSSSSCTTTTHGPP